MAGKAGDVVGLAPLFDHNIALVSQGYSKVRSFENDMLINDFAALYEHVGLPLSFCKLTRDELWRMADEIPWELPKTEEFPDPKAFVADYLLRRQERLKSPEE